MGKYTELLTGVLFRCGTENWVLDGSMLAILGLRLGFDQYLAHNFCLRRLELNWVWRWEESEKCTVCTNKVTRSWRIVCARYFGDFHPNTKQTWIQRICLGLDDHEQDQSEETQRMVLRCQHLLSTRLEHDLFTNMVNACKEVGKVVSIGEIPAVRPDKVLK